MKKRALSLVLVLASLLAMVPAAYAADYTFTDRYGDERTVKDGEYSFATRVVEFTPGSPWTKMEPEQDPNSTLGKPDYVEGSSDCTNLCLGAGGVLVLEFNVSIIDGEGEDIYVFEIGPDAEATQVAVSSDLTTWYDVGTAKGRTTGLDLNGKVPEGGRFRYVRLTDLKEYPNSRWPGADIDAVLALNSKPVTSTWAETEIDKAKEYGLIPDILEGAVMTDPITRLEFAAVSVKTYEKLSGVSALPAVVNPFTDCSDPEMLKAYNLNVAVGVSADTFAPDRLLNREQAAAMLTRVFKRATMPGWSYAEDAKFPLSFTQPAPFADDGEISGWARESVYFMAFNQIINGIGDNKFAPANTTSAQEANHYANATREQALAIAVRMVENFQ